jgi:hypothetical protein
VIVVPIPTQYVASATDLIDCTFRCGYCGAEAKASVLTTSYGVVLGAPFGIDGATEGGRAAAVAHAGLSNEALALAGLVKCPACLRRGRKAVLLAALEFSLPHSLFVGFVAGALFAVAGLGFDLPPSVVGPCGAVTVAIANGWRLLRRRLKRADQMVEFVTPKHGPYRDLPGGRDSD